MNGAVIVVVLGVATLVFLLVTASWGGLSHKDMMDKFNATAPHKRKEDKR